MSETDPSRFPEWLRNARIKRDKRDNLQYYTHLYGNCGYMASLCSECEADERRWMLSTFKTPALLNETPIQYAQRTNLPMLDAWYHVAAKRCAEAKS